MSAAVLNDPIFFYAVAYVIFLGVALVFVRKPAMQWIDGEINKVRHELDHAKRVRTEAEAFLASCKAKQKEANASAQAIITHAKDEAVRLGAEAEENLKFVLARHEQHMTDRIRIAEQEAVAAVRGAVVDAAMAAVRKALAERMDDGMRNKLADQAIATMPAQPSDRAQAA